MYNIAQRKTFALILMLTCLISLCSSVMYTDYSLYELYPAIQTHLKFLQEVYRKKFVNVKFWTSPTSLSTPIQVIIDPTDKEIFLEKCIELKLKHKMLLVNIQKEFDNQKIDKYISSNMSSNNFTWTHFYDLTSIYTWLTDLARNHPMKVKLNLIGTSYENRPIYALEINKGNMKAVMIEGGIHGHEWLSVAFVTYMIQNVLYPEPKNELMNFVSNKYKWLFVPVVNPDGYEYTQTTDRLWRKNREENYKGSYGVDLDRNFDYLHAMFGACSNPTDDHFCGPRPNSEPETVALVKYVRNKSYYLHYYFSIHSYGQKVILPHNNKISHIQRYHAEKATGDVVAQAIKEKSGSIYEVGSIADLYNTRVSGNSAGWIKKVVKVPIVLSLYMRDNGTYGYALPDSKIEDSCSELMFGIIGLIKTEPKYFLTKFAESSANLPKTNYLFIIIFVVFYGTAI